MTKPRTDQAAEPPAPPARSEVGFRFAATFAVVVITLLVVSLMALDRVGQAARAVPAAPSVAVVDDSKQLLDVWQSQGLHGVVLVDATRDTGFAWVPITALPAPADWPVPGLDLQDAYRRAVNRRNLVWVGAMTGIVRSVDYVIPPIDLEQKVRAGREAGQPGVAPDGKSVTANDEGYLRFLRSSPPKDPGTPAVLNIDASYFVNGTPEGLVAALTDSLSEYRLVTINRATDTTDVPDAARQQADRMAEILRAQARK